MTSILDSVKQMLGIGLSDCDFNFDQELIMHTNGVLMILTQLGIGPVSGFRITGNTETWEDFIGERQDLELIKNVVYLRLRLLFDPPQNSFLVKSIEEQIKEYDWRLEVQHNPQEV